MSSCEPKYNLNSPPLNGNSSAHTDYYIYGDNAQRTLNYEPPQSKLDRLGDRIESCPFLPWGHMHCSSCNHQLTKKPFKQTCLSNFCMDKECVKTRTRIRSMKLNDYQIESKNLYHFVIGFKSVEAKDLTKEFRKYCHQTFMKVMKRLNKMYGKYYFLSVRDLNISKNGKIRIHYHIATLPLKDFRKFNSCLKSICEKYDGVAPSYGKYQKKGSVISYFSKRAAGEFGHNRKDERKFGFKDMMNLEQYFKVFYGTKTFNSNFLYRTRERSEFIRMLNNIPKHCPNCKVSTELNIHFEQLMEKHHDPPENIIEMYPEMEIVTVKIPTIKSAEVYK